MKFAKYNKLLLITLMRFLKLRLINEIIKENFIYIIRIIFVFENNLKSYY